MMMVRAKLLLVAACCLVPLTACSTVSGIPAAVELATTPICQGHTADEKMWYAAEAGYNIPAQAYVSANKHGLLTPSLKATLKPKLQELNRLRLAAKKAYEACDSASLKGKLDAITALRDLVLPLIPKVG
jgi:predicted small secreted protein